MDAADTSALAPVGRCVAVWTLATTAGVLAVALGVEAARELRTVPTAPFDEVVVALAGAASLLVCPWLWVLTTWGVLDALRGRDLPTDGGWWRRATMVACGCAATLVVAVPAHARTAPVPTTGEAAELGHDAPTRLLDGLPYPERPSRATPAPTSPAVPAARPTTPASTHHVVRPGETLWSITASHLGDAQTPAADVARAVARLHRANHRVVGVDPDLILPGQRLTLDPIRTHREDPR